MIISRGERSFQKINIVLMSLISLSMVLPIVHVIAQSFSSSVAIDTGWFRSGPSGSQQATTRSFYPTRPSGMQPGTASSLRCSAP